MEEINQQQPVSEVVESPVAATAEVSAQATAPVATPEQVAPPQADNQPKRRDAEARINQLTARYKLTADELSQAQAEIQRLKTSQNAGGPEGTASMQTSENPYATTDTSGEVSQDDLEGLPPAIRQDHVRLQELIRERERDRTQTDLEKTIGTGFETFPELAGMVDDGEIALEASKRRIPLHNMDLVFAGRTVEVLRQQLKDAQAEVASLKGDLHKDTVASPVTGSTKPAPPEQIERQYAPGERMAEARRKAATAKG